MSKLLACVILLAASPIYAAQFGCVPVGECTNGTGTYYFGNGDRYEGKWKDNNRIGKGIYYFANGDRYEGEWKDGIQYGQVTYYFANGDRYEGEWKAGIQYGQRNGQGTWYSADGDRYEGEWKDGKRDGQGTYYFSNGNRYEGEWKDGIQYGQVTYYVANGDRYEGEWKDGEQNGQGTWYSADGDRYEGEWKDGKRDGQGTYYYANGNRYEGEWKDGKRDGRGTLYHANGDRYEGEWKDNRPHGQGNYYPANGVRYEGEWKDGKRDVQGTYYLANGDRYEGEWKDNRPHGQGNYYFANGDHYKGEWVDGERESVEVCVLSVCFAAAPWIYDGRHIALSIAVVVALSMTFYGIRRKYESKRSEALQSAALSLGLSFEDGRDINATIRFGPFHLFSQGSDKKVRNCLSGTIDGVDVTTFGYEYTVDVGEASSFTYRQTVVLFRSKELSLPEFELRPRMTGDRFKDLLGSDEDINFKSHPNFSKSYFLRGKYKSAIRDVFSRSVLDYFESHKGLSAEGRDEILICYRAESHNIYIGYRGARVRPDELKLFIDEGRAVFDLFRMKS